MIPVETAENKQTCILGREPRFVYESLNSKEDKLQQQPLALVKTHGTIRTKLFTQRSPK